MAGMPMNRICDELADACALAKTIETGLAGMPAGYGSDVAAEMALVAQSLSTKLREIEEQLTAHDTAATPEVTLSRLSVADKGG
jgi:hypothetical protein